MGTEIPGSILVVDDQPEVRRFLHRALTRAGHDVALAENGRMALELLGKAPKFDLLIVALLLPDTNGFEVLKFAREHTPGLMFIMVTGSANPQTRARAKSLGVRSFMVKPFDVADLVSECGAAIEAGRSALAG